MGMLRISEITGREPAAPATPKLDMGGFSGLLEEVKKTNQAAAMEKIQDTMERAKSDDHLKIVYEHLSESAKRTLERIKEEQKDVRKDEWLGLCRELKDAGVLTKSDFDYTRADVHLIPLGYTDKSGNFVKYTTSPMMQEKLHNLFVQSQNSKSSSREMWQASDNWSGNPLAYLNDWSKMLYKWRNDMAGMNIYEDFSPIDQQIDSCRKVSDIITKLGGF